jgi:hypothetical protein
VPAGAEQLGVAARLRDLPMLDHQDAIRTLDRRKAVGDEKLVRSRIFSRLVLAHGSTTNSGRSDV